MTKRRCLYHADLGIPAAIPDPVVGAALTYSVHAHTAGRADGVQHLLPRALPPYTLVEVETLYGAPVKWVVRCALDTGRDLVLALTSEYLVKTVWVNAATDTHVTLDATKYDRPEVSELVTA